MTQKNFETAFKKLLKGYGVEVKNLEATVETSLGKVYIKCLDGWIAMRFLDDNFTIKDLVIIPILHQNFK